MTKKHSIFQNIRLSKTIILSFLILVIAACKKDEPIIKTDSVISQFPNVVGNHWHYKYIKDDSTTSFIDVDIIGEGKTNEGTKAMVWVYKILNNTDTSYVVTDGDSIRFYYPPCIGCTGPAPEKMRYILPFEVGKIWINYNIKDTTKIISQSNITVPTNTFANTYYLKRNREPITNSWINEQIWITPGIGVVKLIQEDYSLGAVLGNGLWELESYSLK